MEPASLARNEEIRCLLRAKKLRPAELEVGLDGFTGCRGQGNVPVLPSFALVDPKRSLFEVHVPGLEIRELRRPEARGVEELEDGPVPEASG